MNPHFSSWLRFWLLFSLVPGLLIGGVSGCTSFSVSEHLLWSTSKQKEKDLQVVEIMALWQPGEGRDTRGLPCRGFAGQIFFFKQGSRTPSKVDGDVKVYVFDNQGTEQEQAKPIHIYEFHGPAWDVYNAKSNIGEAYQVFIPYTRPGTHRAICSLRVKYTGKNSEMVLSDPADVILKGNTEKIPSTSVVSDQREAKLSTLPNQQTHVATINRAGKVQPYQPGSHPPAGQDQRVGREASELELVGHQSELDASPSVRTSFQKNTQVTHTTQKSQIHSQPGQISGQTEQATYTVEQPATLQPSGSLIEQASWQQEFSLEQSTLSRKPASLLPESSPQTLQTLHPVQATRNPQSSAHPLSDLLPQNRLTTRPVTDSPPDKLQNGLQTLQPQPESHPLSIERKSAISPKSSLKIETITLE